MLGGKRLFPKLSDPPRVKSHLVWQEKRRRLLRWNFGAGERRISIRTPLALRNSFGTLYRLSIRARAHSRVCNHATTPADRWRGGVDFFKTGAPSGRGGASGFL